MPKGTKHDDATAIRAVEYWAEGDTCAKIAQRLRIPKKTIENWKRKNWPEHWESKRAERLATKAQILEEESLESYKKTTVRQQKMLRAVTHRFARKLVEMNDQDLPPDIAAKYLERFIEQEKELFMDNEELIRLNKGKGSAPVAAFGARSNGQGGMDVVGYLQSAFNEINDKDDDSDS